MPQRITSLFPKSSKFWGIRRGTKPHYAQNQTNADTKLKSQQLHFEAAPIQTEIPEPKSETADGRSDPPCSATGASIHQGTTQTEIIIARKKYSHKSLRIERANFEFHCTLLTILTE